MLRITKKMSKKVWVFLGFLDFFSRFKVHLQKRQKNPNTSANVWISPKQDQVVNSSGSASNRNDYSRILVFKFFQESQKVWYQSQDKNLGRSASTTTGRRDKYYLLFITKGKKHQLGRGILLATYSLITGWQKV